MPQRTDSANRAGSRVSRWLMARITVIPDDAWDGELGELYPRVVDRTYGRVDNILAIHSLNPAPWPHTKASMNRPWPAPRRCARPNASSSPWS